MKVEYDISLISDNNKKFRIGSDIYFTYLYNGKKYTCIGIISKISIDRDEFEIRNVVLDGFYLAKDLKIKYNNVENGIIDSTSNAYY